MTMAWLIVFVCLSYIQGAQWLGAMSVLCEVTCKDESVYTLYCAIKGQLVEVNENLLKNPSLLSKKVFEQGGKGHSIAKHL